MYVTTTILELISINGRNLTLYNRIDFVESCSNHVHDTNVKDHSSAKKFHLLSSRPELAYHAGKKKWDSSYHRCLSSFFVKVNNVAWNISLLLHVYTKIYLYKYIMDHQI